MLKKSLIALAILVGSLNAGMFGALAGAALGGGSTASAVSGSDVQAVLTNFQQAQLGLDSSVMLINSALGDKKQVAEFEKRAKEINSKPESSEKDAANKELKKDELASAEKLATSKDAQDKAKKLSSEQKVKVGASISNLLLVAMKDTTALASAKGLVSSISSNPSAAMQFATDLPKLKDVVMTIPTQLSSLGTLTSGLTTLAKNADITVNQPKADDKVSTKVETF